MQEVEALQCRRDNVFADLGFPDPELQQRKADIVIRLNDVASANNWDDARVASLLGLSPEQYEDIADGVVSEVDLEQLSGYLVLLEDAQVESERRQPQPIAGRGHGPLSGSSCLPLVASDDRSSTEKVQF